MPRRDSYPLRKERIFLLLEARNIEKYYGERKILELSCLSLYEDDKVAVVGRNGTGKTTLLNILAGDTKPDSGYVNVKGSLAYMHQLGEPGAGYTNSRVAGKLGLLHGAYSGGEKVKLRIAQAFSSQVQIMLADEPTSNLDMNSIRCLEQMLLEFKGGLIIVSHDRALLKKVCNKVLEIEQGFCTLYNCGYEDYLGQKELEKETQKARYEKYIAERDRLKSAASEKARKSARTRRTPKRMGNSEARLHRMGGQKAKSNLDRAAKSMRSRLEQLEKVPKPWEQKDIVFDVTPGSVHSRVLVRVQGVSKSFDGRVVLENCSFIIPNNKKTALIGDNGTGKTTLLNMIMYANEGIEKCSNLKIGYFRQDTSDIADDKSVLENARAESVYDQNFTRTILARLLLNRDMADKKAGVISGGERIKLSIARIILSGFNLLILDEPTNYLDIESMRALESVLAAYPGAMLIVSHDREFVRNIADRVILIKDKTTHIFEEVGGL